MKKLVCIAIEDEAPAIGLLRSYIDNFPQLELKADFTNALKAREFLKEEKVDVLFLDIQLPGISGMEFLRLLDHPPLVVITSAYNEHAVEAFGLEVFDYLLKPYSLGRFTKTVARLEKHFKPERDDVAIPIKEGWEHRKLRLVELHYIESNREYLIFYLKGGKTIKARMTMEEGMELFPKKTLLRIHRSFMVPVNLIQSITSKEVILENETLPLGRSYKEHVMNRWRSV